MDPTKEKTLVDLLNRYDVAGVPFARAKAELLQKGYSEADIVYGLYSAPFDGKTNNEKRPSNPLEEIYSKDPKKADKVAKILLLDQAQKARDEAYANAGAASFGIDTHSRSYYEVRTADKLGIPYYTIFFAALIFIIVSIKFKLSQETTQLILTGFSVFISIIFGWRLLRHQLDIRKLKQEVSSDDRSDNQGGKT